jgi:prepilin-type N-terminal cleavage/methylation domain-containing protein/prepilin-type processing-associated H-X9-DG protein
VNSPTRRLGFTLIELLVVVAIIGILASLLLATLSQGCRAAKSAKCINNLRQLGMALQMYVNDNEKYPGGGQLPNQPDWVWAIAPYLADRAIIGDEPKQHTAVRSGSATVFKCPARKSERYLQVGDQIDYGYNVAGYANRGLGCSTVTGDLNLYALTAESEIEVPTDMIALGDGMRRIKQWLCPVDSVIERISLLYDPELLLRAAREGHRAARRRHAERINLSYCDGHVEALTLKKAFYAETHDALRKWNRDHEPHLDEWRKAIQ